MRFRRLLPALTAACLLAAPAEASTVPVVELPAGKTAAAIGLSGVPGADLSLDHAFGDRWSLGATTVLEPEAMFGAPSSYVPSRANFLSWAARTTYRFSGDGAGLDWGVTLAAGRVRPFWATAGANGAAPPPFLWFVQPALVGSWGFALGPVPMKLRGTLGPVAMVGPVGEAPNVFPLWPNLELAFPLAQAHEITVGGGIVGYRGMF